MSNKLETNKDRADADRYYKLFADKVGKIKDGERILFIHIGNFDVLNKFIQSSFNCSYYIIDQYLNGPWFKMNWVCKFIGTNEDDSIDKTLETIDMKFDKIIMNPPYNKTLHLDILAKAIEKLDKNGTCVNLSPIRWLQDPLIKFNLSNVYSTYKKSICDNVTDFEIIPAELSNKIFNIAHGDLGIYVCRKNAEKTFDFSILLKQFDKYIGFLNKLHVNNTYYRTKDFGIDSSTKEKCIKNTEAFLNKLKKSYEYFILLTRANGSMNATWQSSVISKYGVLSKNELKEALIKNPGRKKVMGFMKSELENAQSLLKFIHMNCLRFGLAITQDSQNVTEKCYTFFPDVDYSKFKTEQDFYKYFGITKDEQKLIEETMEKYK